VRACLRACARVRLLAYVHSRSHFSVLILGRACVTLP